MKKVLLDMRRRSNILFRSHVDRDVADHAETLSCRHNWYVNDMDLLVASLQRLIGTLTKPTNLRDCKQDTN